MRSTVLAYQDEFDEVPVSPTDVLEANVIALREELKEHKADFEDFKIEVRAALASLDNDLRTSVAERRSEIKTSVAELRPEIRAVAARARDDMRDYAARHDAQQAEMRRDHKELRDLRSTSSTRTSLSPSAAKLNALFWALGSSSSLRLPQAAWAGSDFMLSRQAKGRRQIQYNARRFPQISA